MMRLIKIRQSFFKGQAVTHLYFCIGLVFFACLFLIFTRNRIELVGKAITLYAFVLISIYAGRRIAKKWLAKSKVLSNIALSIAFIGIISGIVTPFWSLVITNHKRFPVELFSISIPLTILLMLIGVFLTLLSSAAAQKKNINSGHTLTPTLHFELSRKLETENLDQFIFVKTAGKVWKIEYDDLLYAEASGNHTKVITNNILITPMSFTNFEKLLPKTHFIRIHRSFIINKHRISHINGNRVFIEKHEIPIGKNFKKLFFEIIGL